MTTPTTPSMTPIVYAGSASKGVAMVTPPDNLLPSITAAITKACADLPVGRTAAAVAIADIHGANIAYVQKIGEKVKVMAWAGRKWGEPIEGGASVMVSW